jgi:hypothetical protein
MYGQKVEFWNKKAQILDSLTNEINGRIEILEQNKPFNVDTLFSLKSKYVNAVELLDSSIMGRSKKIIDPFLNRYNSTLSLEFILEKAKNDILALESEVSGYFDDQVSAIIEDYTFFSVMLSQNSNQLRPGDTLEISTGIGAFTSAADPTFLINGKIVYPDKSARVDYKMTVKGSGEQIVPIKIMYTSSTGVKESKDFKVRYFVRH